MNPPLTRVSHSPDAPPRIGRLLKRMGVRVIPAIAAGNHVLDLGRHPASLGEIESRFVNDPAFAGSSTRAAIWQEFISATELLRRNVSVAAVWIGGSFTSTKLDPGDIDCTYLIDVQHAVDAHSDPARAGVLAQFATPNSLKPLGYRVDHFICVWRDVPDPAIVPRTGPEWDYYRMRGHWDDWWQRERVSPAGTFARDDALPRRGYLEVVLDGF